MSGADNLLHDLYQLVCDEQHAANQQLLATWERPLSEKLLKGITQGFVRLERGPESGTLWAFTDDTESRFREGDLLCLRQGDALVPLCQRLSFWQRLPPHRPSLRRRRQNPSHALPLAVE